MHRFRKAALAGVAVLLAWLGVVGAAAAAPALWLVRNERTEIYLFGTLHALPPGTAWRTAAYDRAFARADTVWFEAPLDEADPQAMSRIVDRYGVDRARPLSRKLAPRTLAQLQRQVDLAQVDHLRPWAAALMLSMKPSPGGRATIEAGADLTMIRIARAQAKPVRTFETMEDQTMIFANLSEGAELRYLADVIRERTPRRRLAPRAPGETLDQAWLSGDLTRLGPELVGGMKASNPALYEALLKRRNLAWADALTGEMDRGGVELVNVGALHLLGEDGLPALLAKRGFEVLRVQ